MHQTMYNKKMCDIYTLVTVTVYLHIYYSYVFYCFINFTILLLLYSLFSLCKTILDFSSPSSSFSSIAHKHTHTNKPTQTRLHKQTNRERESCCKDVESILI